MIIKLLNRKKIVLLHYNWLEGYRVYLAGVVILYLQYHMIHLLKISIWVLLLLFTSISAKSQTNTWTGAGSNDWHLGCNWSLAIVPTCAHNVVIPTVSTYPTITGTAHCASLSITSTASNALTVNSYGGGILYVASGGGSCGGTATDNAGSPPSAPVATAATNVTRCSFDANWNAVAGAAGYQIRYGLGAYTDVGNVLTVLSYDGFCNCGSNITYQVKAYSAGGCSVSAASNLITLYY